MSERVLRASLTVPLERERVFPFFADAWNLERITPPELRFRVTTSPPVEMREGALIDYRLRLFGVPFAWRTRIARFEPDEVFVDEQLRGPYRKWVHTHRFTRVPDGTRVDDEVRYTLPMDPWSRPALPVVRRELERIFRYRRDATWSALVGGAA